MKVKYNKKSLGQRSLCYLRNNIVGGEYFLVRWLEGKIYVTLFEVGRYFNKIEKVFGEKLHLQLLPVE